jgi:hypothetical protein
MKPIVWVVSCSQLACALRRALELDWQRFQDTDVIEVLTHDEDGELRETSVWIVAFDGHGYVRTNDSRWLANIRRGSSVALRLGTDEFPVARASPTTPRSPRASRRHSSRSTASRSA